MSNRLAPSATVAKRRMPMRISLIAAAVPALFVCNVAMAQVSGMASPTPTMGATSPLGIASGSSVSPTGIPLGSTEIASPGVSPMPTYSTGTIAMPGSSTTCSTLGTSPSAMFGSTATYDGGGTAAGAATPATAMSGTSMSSGISSSSGISATSGMSTTSGMLATTGLSGMCGSGSSSVASSSTPTSTSPTTPGGAARTGIPLGSMEIGNLGVSSAATVPTIGVSPYVGAATLVPTMPTVSSPTTSTMPGLTTGTTGTTGTSIIPGG
jgi:hypothetical protein